MACTLQCSWIWYTYEILTVHIFTSNYLTTNKKYVLVWNPFIANFGLTYLVFNNICISIWKLWYVNGLISRGGFEFSYLYYGYLTGAQKIYIMKPEIYIDLHFIILVNWSVKVDQELCDITSILTRPTVHFTITR